jgi:hypothetical protein
MRSHVGVKPRGVHQPESILAEKHPIDFQHQPTHVNLASRLTTSCGPRPFQTATRTAKDIHRKNHWWSLLHNCPLTHARLLHVRFLHSIASHNAFAAPAVNCLCKITDTCCHLVTKKPHTPLQNERTRAQRFREAFKGGPDSIASQGKTHGYEGVHNK